MSHAMVLMLATVSAHASSGCLETTRKCNGTASITMAMQMPPVSPPDRAERYVNDVTFALAPNGVGGDSLRRDLHRQDHPTLVESQLIDAHHTVIAIGFPQRTTMVDDVPFLR